MGFEQRVQALIEKARKAVKSSKGNHRALTKGLIAAYEQVIGIYREEQDGELQSAAEQFCAELCWYGQGDSRGEAAECKPCTLAPHTLTDGGIEHEEIDHELEERRRAQRQRDSAQRALAAMRAKGQDTLSGHDSGRHAQHRRSMYAADEADE